MLNCIVPGFIPASSDTEESEGAADKAVLNKVHEKSKKFSFKIYC
jgi:hypothetical protein